MTVASLWYKKEILRGMYWNTRPTIYRSPRMYRFQMTFKNGKTQDVSFDIEEPKTPYDFVLRVLFPLFDLHEIVEGELSKDGKYLESYRPVCGWFKK